MKVFVVFLLSCFLSFPALASTVIEMGAAAAIANEVKQTGQANPASTMNQVKQNIEQYEKASQKQEAHTASEQVEGNERYSEVSSGAQAQDERSPQSLEDQNQTEPGDEELETNPVDYKAGIQVFYKRTCPAEQKNCNRGAVLTNIKSVIFDYAHSRGSFSASAEK